MSIRSDPRVSFRSAWAMVRCSPTRRASRRSCAASTARATVVGGQEHGGTGQEGLVPPRPAAQAVDDRLGIGQDGWPARQRSRSSARALAEW